MKPIRVVIIDDHPLFRTGVAELLQPDADFNLIGEADNGRDGIRLVEQLAPDLVLIDINMKHMNGVAVLNQLKPKSTQRCCVMLTMSNSEEDFINCMQAGASGYLLKDMDPTLIAQACKRAVAGDTVLNNEFRLMLNHSQGAAEHSSSNSSPEAITPREQQIAKQVSLGLSNKLIADELTISENTVKAHLRNLMAKLNLNSRLELAIWYKTEPQINA